MPYISRRERDYALILDEKTYNEMGFNAKKTLDVIKVKQGVWVFVERETSSASETEKIKERVFKKLSNARLSDRVIGRFELVLNEKEKSALKELVKEKKVIEFKLSDKYSKAIYKANNFKPVLKEGQSKPKKLFSSQNNSFTQKNFLKEFDLEQDGFTIIKSEEKAKKLSLSLSEKIKKKQLFGTRSFDENYYLIYAWKYKQVEPKILGLLKQKKEMDLNELSSETGFPREVIKIVCEFLREKGEILEKRKEFYKYIEG